MTLKKYKYCSISIIQIVILFVVLLSFSSVYAQEAVKKSIKKTNDDKKNQEQIKVVPTAIPMTPLNANDSLRIAVSDSMSTNKSKSGIDSLVTFFGRDTVVFNLKTQMMRLKGNAYIDFKDQKLDADIIEISFKESLMKASAGIDSNNKAVGFPKFNDKGEEFYGEKILYNFKSNKGIISGGETKISEGFYYGSKIKRISQSELFVQDGYYTTCDAPHPHYYFGSPEMKVAVQDRIFIDPLIFYVEDIPIFALPFGLFFPNKSGRQSGLIVPGFYFSKSRGVVIEDLGFYWAASDYWDTQILTDYYSKGGYLLKNKTRWALRNIFRGSYDVSFGKTRYSLDEPYTKAYQIAVNHIHDITPYQRADVNINFASQDFNRKTSTNVNQRIRQNMTSNASYSSTFDNGSNFSMSYQRDQNIITNEYTQRFPLNYSLPSFYPVKKMTDISSNKWYSWVKDISVSYRGSYIFSDNKNIALKSIALNDTVKIDTNYVYKNSNVISHNPSISISPKFGYFSITPSVSFAANNYFRRINRYFDDTDSTAKDIIDNGFYSEYWYSFALSVSTKLYGIADKSRPLLGFVNPNWLGVKAFRHTYQPSFSFSFNPDFSGDNYGFYGTYLDKRTNQNVKYSRFAMESSSHAYSNLSKSLSYSDLHSFEMKIKETDSTDKNIELLQLRFGTSYNFAADSIKLSDINVSFRTPALSYVEFSGSANYTLYDESKTENNGYTTYRRINKFLYENNKAIARLTNFSMSMSTSLSSSGLVDRSKSFSQTDQDSTAKDSELTLGERFTKRNQMAEDGFDYYGDGRPGYSDLSFPWTLNMAVIYSYSRPTQAKANQSCDLSAVLNVNLTQTWSVNATARYDLIKMELLTPQINLRKDLHCWDLIFNWTPTGYNRGFYLRFGIKASMLSDLKLEKRSSPIFR